MSELPTGTEIKQGYAVFNKFMLANVVSYATHSSGTCLKEYEIYGTLFVHVARGVSIDTLVSYYCYI